MQVAVYIQTWESKTRGLTLGSDRDGYSVHLFKKDCGKFIAVFCERQSIRVAENGRVSTPVGEPFQALVGEDVFKEVMKYEYGARYRKRPLSFRRLNRGRVGPPDR